MTNGKAENPDLEQAVLGWALKNKGFLHQGHKGFVALGPDFGEPFHRELWNLLISSDMREFSVSESGYAPIYKAGTFAKMPDMGLEDGEEAFGYVKSLMRATPEWTPIDFFQAVTRLNEGEAKNA